MKQSIQKVVIDFDDTLFNTHAFKRALCETAEQFGYTAEEFWKTYRDVRDGNPGLLHYTIEDHAVHLHRLRPVGIEMGELLRAFHSVLNTNDFVFHEAEDLLSYVKSAGKKLILLSLGAPEFQRFKIHMSGLDAFFDRIEVVNSRKVHVAGQIAEPEEEVYFINDKPRETHEVVAAYPAWHAILKMRSDVPHKEYAESGLPCFHELHEIKTYLSEHV